MHLTGTVNRNSFSLLWLNTLIGMAMVLGFIGSLSYLLSVTNPLYAIYMGAVGHSFFALVLRFGVIKRLKFANFTVFMAFIYLLLLVGVLYAPWPEATRAVTWFGLSIFGIAFFQWAVFRLTVLHLNPASSQAQFFYNHRAYECGGLLVATVLLVVFPNIPPTHLLDTVILLVALSALYLVVTLCPKRNIEIDIDKKHPQESLHNVPAFKVMAFYFSIAVLFIGMMEVLSSYAVILSVKTVSGSYGKIIETVAMIFLFSSMALISVSSVTAWGIEKYRSSPIPLFFFHCILVFGVAFYCFFYPSPVSFILLMIILFTSQGAFYVPATQTVLAAFPSGERHRLHTMHQQYAFAVPFIIASVALTFTYDPGYKNTVPFVLIAILLCAVIGMLYIILFRTALIRAFYYNIRLEDKAAAVLAAQALSYLNPRDYSARMLEILQANPKKLLRKMIIMGLGFKGNQDVIQQLRKEFESDKEEIQLSVLDALSHCRDFSNVEFMIEVLLGKHLTRSVNVRISAAKTLAGLYGKRAIPILLYGLHDEDKRIQANALEVLSMFKDKSLLGAVKPFITSPNARIRANALLALSRFNSEVETYRQGITEMLTSNNETLMASALYVIGKNRDSYFLDTILLLLKLGYHEKPAMKRILAHTLTGLRHKKGYELFEELFNLPYRPGTQEDFVHLFAQLNYAMRFDVLEYLLRKNQGNTVFHDNIYQHLKNATFDFHEEMDYLFA